MTDHLNASHYGLYLTIFFAKTSGKFPLDFEIVDWRICNIFTPVQRKTKPDEILAVNAFIISLLKWTIPFRKGG